LAALADDAGQGMCAYAKQRSACRQPTQAVNPGVGVAAGQVDAGQIA
jgi:hypothetical protein